MSSSQSTPLLAPDTLSIRATAPAKIMVMGEYVVLDHAPAIVMAFDRYMKVSLRAIPGDYYQFESPHWQDDITASPVAIKLDSRGDLLWQSPDEVARSRYGLVADILQSMNQIGLMSQATPPFNASLDSLDFFLGRGAAATKLGLGSSAALTISLTAALASYSGNTPLLTDKASWLQQVFHIHQRYQRNQGSGADLAASLYGGVIIYQLDRLTRAPQIKSVTWPKDLYFLCIWSGRAASTPDYLSQFYAWRRAQPVLATRLLDALTEMATAASEALQNSDAKSLLEYLSRYASGLKRLSFSSGIPIFSPQHQHIQALADTVGAVYKSCGAGGGDIGMAFSLDPRCLEELRQKLLSSGFVILEGHIDHTGLQVEPIV